MEVLLPPPGTILRTKIRSPNRHIAAQLTHLIGMPPKSSSTDKGKGKSKGDAQSGGAKLKAATSINVRHILVSAERPNVFHRPSPDPFGQCEKHSKKEEALAKLRDGAKFDDVAREFSEDKARQGTTKCDLAPPILL